LAVTANILDKHELYYFKELVSSMMINHLLKRNIQEEGVMIGVSI
jgi:hypothetical protein